ncbi:MAG TPA: hypothetical protein PKZ54_10370 [Syntrophorhabdaceae bacterium]|nr:hypothetical protein [Syntrophorhabdaceae bacterium]
MKLSVKKLSKDVTKQDLEELFRPYSVTNIELKGSNEGDKFAFIELPDQMAKKAVEKLDNFPLKGKNIRVRVRNESNPVTQQTNQKKENPHLKQQDTSNKKGKNSYTGTFPYNFWKRKANKKTLSESHDRLLPGHYDIAFEIEWETLTPTALNPILDEKEPSCYPENDDDEYTGYNRRWLLIDGHLAISPFTVKSAIANGFANLLGGCYRVNNRVEGHKESEGKGKYPYPGAYKRYRVAMDGSSKPGIVKSIKKLENKDREISIQPIKEYYLDEELPGAFKNIKQGDKVYANIIQERKQKPPIISLVKTPDANSIKLKYHGPFRYGKDSKHHNRHKYRFYKENGNEVSGTIPAINFESKEELKKVVSIGGADSKDNPTEWYQDLNDIKVGSIVYYEIFGGKVTNIGKNFLFKALFHHEDTVPEENSECIKITGSLCPRCRMFGLTDKAVDEKGNEKESLGYKGRFKSSTLINNLTLTERENPDFISVRDINIKIPLKVWIDKNTKDDIVATQEFLPISGSPKPNKRDINGYFNKETGKLKGAKYYLHGRLNSARNIQGVDTKNDKDYSHKLRNYAQVVRPRLTFKGTVGAENCNLEEITAFLMLLHSDFSNHGFKIGLGKAFGMGSVKSSIRKIWIRKSNDYENWHIIENKGTKEDLLSQLETHIKGITNTYETFEGIIAKTEKILNNLKGMESRSLKYPEVEIDKDKKKDNNKEKNKKVDYWKLACGNK